jgi:hypothetical protein
MKVTVCVALSAMLLAGCATVTRGTSDVFVVNTDPSGAAVKTSNQFACDETPCSLKMPRKSEFEVTITKKGYKTWQGHVTHKVATAGGAGMAGNVLLGGLIGAGVDVASGAMMDLVPNPLTVKLEVEAPVAPAAVVAAAPAVVVPALSPAEAAPTVVKVVAPQAAQGPKPVARRRCAITSPTDPSAVTC